MRNQEEPKKPPNVPKVEPKDLKVEPPRHELEGIEVFAHVDKSETLQNRHELSGLQVLAHISKQEDLGLSSSG